MSTPTSTPSPSSSSSSDSSDAVLNYTALVVALVALVVSALQLILQYVLSAESRSKCGSAAIGPWAKRNRQYWIFWKGKLSIKYIRPIISREQVFRSMKVQTTIHQKNLDALANFKVEQKAPYNETLYGIQPRGNPELVLTRRGTEETSPTFVNALRGREREAADSLLHNMKRLFSPTQPTKATWCAILCDLGLDIRALPDNGEYIDAETIPSGLEAPTMQIRMSDIIQFGLLLDMAIVEVDELKRVVNMTGRHCSLISHYKDTVGMISRYSGMAYDALPYVRRIDHMEARMLCDTADGMIYIGDCMTLISSWGFNSVDATFKQALRNCQDNRWQDMQVDDVVRSAQADGPHTFGGKWADPATPIIGLLMAVCGNAAVANAFPHTPIHGWTDQAKSSVLREASDAIEQRLGFTIAPDDIFQRIWDSNSDIMIMDEYKTASNYGCQLGGIRGWLCTNLAEFTLRVSRLWQAEPNTGDYYPVPIIPQLHPLVITGVLSKEWGEGYQALEGTKKSWKLPATAMLWFQITLLDTWLARHVDIIIGETAMPEMSVPAELRAAELCAKATTVLDQSTGWNPPRLRFCRLYLARLANGVGKAGPSFMSKTKLEDRTMGWNQMPVGTPEQWLVIDAVLSLRAVLMHTRYMLMKDSSALLSMRFDPMLLLA